MNRDRIIKAKDFAVLSLILIFLGSLGLAGTLGISIDTLAHVPAVVPELPKTVISMGALMGVIAIAAAIVFLTRALYIIMEELNR